MKIEELKKQKEELKKQKEELQKEIEKLQKEIEKIEEEEKERAKFGEADIDQAFKKALDNNELRYHHFRNFAYDGNTTIIDRTEQYLKMPLEPENLEIHEFLLEQGYDWLNSIIGVVYKGELVFGLYNDGYGEGHFITANKTKRIYKDYSWDFI